MDMRQVQDRVELERERVRLRAQRAVEMRRPSEERDDHLVNLIDELIRDLNTEIEEVP